jgi:hypothetical protein
MSGLPVTVCLHCAMRALLVGEPVPHFPETPAEHTARVHPDLDAARVERLEMEHELCRRFEKAEQAGNN